jgi:serine/threonine protein phosphatase PrpC
MMSKISFWGATHVGNVRELNEDSYLVDEEHGLWVLADGMGGHGGGEVASRIVVDFVQESVAKGTPLAEAVAQAHGVVQMAADQGLGIPGMGATLVAVKLEQSTYRLAWVGDSRAYLWDGQLLQQLTRDHSLVQHLIDAGQISEDEARQHPYRNCVTQAVGAADLDNVSVDEVTGTFYRGHQLLLCSDGLTVGVTDAEIRAVLQQGNDEQATTQQLIDLALERGGSDNVTVLLISASEDAPRQEINDNTIPIVTDSVSRAAASD